MGIRKKRRNRRKEGKRHEENGKRIPKEGKIKYNNSKWNTTQT
jgi:hypothetical protein